MNQTQNVKKRVRFSIVDFVLVLTFLACIVGLLVRYDITDNIFTKTDSEEHTVHFSAEALSEGQLSSFSEKAVFYTGEQTFGRLSSYNASTATELIEKNDGTLAFYEKDGLYDVSGSFVCKLVSTDKGYLLNGRTYIAAGSVFTVNSKGTVISVTVMEIE